jgi:hypothetical protein
MWKIELKIILSNTGLWIFFSSLKFEIFDVNFEFLKENHNTKEIIKQLFFKENSQRYTPKLGNEIKLLWTFERLFKLVFSYVFWKILNDNKIPGFKQYIIKYFALCLKIWFSQE